MEIKRNRFERFRAWLRRHQFMLIVIPCSLMIVAAGAISAMVLWGPKDSETITDVEEEKEAAPDPVVKYFSRLTGRELANKEAVNQAATCVMIENSPEARPQSGLKDAGVIYEAIAEGGITRFMAVFQDAMPALIGPVRSVRMYYLEWAVPYHCTIAHAGGAGDALAAIGGYRHVSENYTQYWRARDRYAPHNLYTNGERMTEYNASKGYTSSEFEGLTRAIGEVVPTRSAENATNITLDFTGKTWNVNYTYDAATKSYLRSHQSGGPHMDKAADGSLAQNSPTVVVAIMTTDVQRPYTSYRNVVTTGTGVAHVFQNGEHMAATWTKNSVDSELKLYGQDNEAIALNPGQVWITSVPNNKIVSWE